MAKPVKKKSAKEASSIFHNIMAASVKGNPKPTQIKMTRNQLKKLSEDVLKKFAAMIVAAEDYADVTPLRLASELKILKTYQQANKEYIEAKNKWETALVDFAIEKQIHANKA